MKLYLTVQDILEDETIQVLMADVENYSGAEDKQKELIKRMVQVANSHIWGALIWLAQQEENEKAEESE